MNLTADNTISKGSFLSPEELIVRNLDIAAASWSEFLGKYEKLSKEGIAVCKRKLQTETWLVKNKNDETTCILETVSKTYTGQAKKQRTISTIAFEKEIILQRRLIHPNILQVLNYFEDDNKMCIVTEHTEKGMLFSLIKAAGKLTESEAYKYFSQVCEAVAFLHTSKLVHRDLRPENMRITKDSVLKLSNFACCTEISDELYAICCLFKMSASK